MSAPPRWLTADLVLLDDSCPLPLDRPFTAHQAAALGVSRWYLGALLRRALVREVLRGVYVAAQVPETIELKIAALRRVVPSSAVVTDRTAAWLHGVDALPRSAVHAAPPVEVFDRRQSARMRRPGVHGGERRLSDDDVMVIDGIHVTTPLRTALDLGRLLPRYDALAAIDGLLRVGVSRTALLAQVERFRGQRGVIQLRSLAPLGDARAESPAESVLRGHWVDCGLPAPEPQCWVHDELGVPTFRLDLGLPALRFGAEYHGRRFHEGDETERHDARRLEWLQESAGWTVVVFWREDLFGPDANPAARLLAGIREARTNLGRWQPQGRFLGSPAAVTDRPSDRSTTDGWGASGLQA